MTAFGLILLVIGAVVAVAEAHYPAHGIAGGIGVLAMAVGAVLTISGLGGGLLVGLLAGGVLAGGGAALIKQVIDQAQSVRDRPVRTGDGGLIGHIGVVRSWNEDGGSVSLDGAVWRALESPGPDEEPEPLHPGDPVVVERLSGLTVSVRRAEQWELL